MGPKHSVILLLPIRDDIPMLYEAGLKLSFRQKTFTAHVRYKDVASAWISYQANRHLGMDTLAAYEDAMAVTFDSAYHQELITQEFDRKVLANIQHVLNTRQVDTDDRIFITVRSEALELYIPHSAALPRPY